MDKTMDKTILYAVLSDLEGISTTVNYAEFTDAESAIEYARAHVDELPYVERMEVTLDEFGNIEDIFSTETIWVYSDAPEYPEHIVLGEGIAIPDTQKSFSTKAISKRSGRKFDTPSMKDTLYKNNTGVSDLSDLQYEDLSTDVIASDKVFQLDFPEYKKTARGPELVTDEEEVEETEEEPVEFTAEEAVPYLIEDEEEAISSYEKATEVIEDSELDNKKAILAALKHIKKEEEEHLAELSDLIDSDSDEEESEEESETLTEATAVMDAEEATDVSDFGDDDTDFDGSSVSSYEGDSFDDGVESSGTALVPVNSEDTGALTGEVVPLANDGADLPADSGKEDIVSTDFKDLDAESEVAAGGGGSSADDVKDALAGIGGTIAGSAGKLGAGVLGAISDIHGVAAKKAELKKARLDTQIRKAETDTAVQDIQKKSAMKRSEWQNIRYERAKARAAATAAKGRLGVARIDSRTTKELANQADSVRNAQADLVTARLQNRALAHQVGIAKKKAKTTDDVMNARSDRETAWHQRIAQHHNAAAAKDIAQTTDDRILARSNKLARADDMIAAVYRNAGEKTNANTMKSLSKQTAPVVQAYADRYASAQKDIAAINKNIEARVNANTAKHDAKQDPQVKKVLTQLETDKVVKKDAEVKTAIGKELAKQNPERDQALKDRAVKQVKLGTAAMNNLNYQYQNPEAVETKKEIQNTKLAKSLAKEQKKLKDYEAQNNLKVDQDAEQAVVDESLSLTENTVFRSLLPKRSKEYFKMLVNDYKPVVLFREKRVAQGGLFSSESVTYVTVYDGEGYAVLTAPAKSANDDYFDQDDTAVIAYFQNYEDLWEYIQEMVAQSNIEPEYNYIFTEGLHESMIVTETVSIRRALTPHASRRSFDGLLIKNGAVQLYHENSAVFGSNSKEYFVRISPSGGYELISEDSKNNITSEDFFDDYDDLYSYVSDLMQSTHLYTPDLILTDK